MVTAIKSRSIVCLISQFYIPSHYRYVDIKNLRACKILPILRGLVKFFNLQYVLSSAIEKMISFQLRYKKPFNYKLESNKIWTLDVFNFWPIFKNVKRGFEKRGK